jgi:hypothetical protein
VTRSPSTPPPVTRSPSTPPPPAILALLLALGLSSVGTGCQSWTTADYARTTLEAVAQASIAGGESVVSAYCNAQLIAAGYPRGGRVTNGHCAPGDGVPLHVATPEQVQAVETVRVRWHTVSVAWDGVVTAHTIAAGLLGRGGDTENLLPAIGQVSTAYTALQIAAESVGAPIPPALIPAANSLPLTRD